MLETYWCRTIYNTVTHFNVLITIGVISLVGPGGQVDIDMYLGSGCVMTTLQTMHAPHEPGCHSIQHAARKMLQYEATVQHGWHRTGREGCLKLGGIAQAPVKQQQGKKWSSSKEISDGVVLGVSPLDRIVNQVEYAPKPLCYTRLGKRSQSSCL